MQHAQKEKMEGETEWGEGPRVRPVGQGQQHRVTDQQASNLRMESIVLCALLYLYPDLGDRNTEGCMNSRVQDLQNNETGLEVM